MVGAHAKTHLPLLVTTSAQSCHQRCPREYEIAYVLGYRPIAKEEALSMGSLWHVGQENYWLSAGSVPKALAAMAKSFEIESKKPGYPLDAFDLAKARAMLVVYDARWSVVAADWEVLAVEKEFRAPIVHPDTGKVSTLVELGGKIDVIVRLPELAVPAGISREAIVEHKSTSLDITPGSPYFVKLAIDGQVSNYHVGGRALGYDIGQCVYDVAKKPGIIPYKKTAEIKLKKDGTPYANTRLADETPAEYEARCLALLTERPDEYFARATVVRLEDEEKDAARDLWHVAHSMATATHFPRHQLSCERYRRFCAYLPVCGKSASLDDATMYRRAERAHEELAA